MNQPRGLVKIATICVFILLVSGFVAFRAGVFHRGTPENRMKSIVQQALDMDSAKIKSLTGGSAPKKSDTVPLVNYHFSSSKSLSVPDDHMYQVIKDIKESYLPVQPKTETPKKDSFYLNHLQIMLSSKSTMIVPGTEGYVWDLSPEPDTVKTVKVDSFFLDDNETLGSSKSAFIYRPKPVIIKLDTGKKKKN